MRPTRAVFLAILLLPAVLPAATAEVGPIVQPNPASTSGITPDVAFHSASGTIVVAHYNNVNGLLMSISTDGGTSWTNRATGITLSGQKVWVVVDDATTFRAIYSAGCTINVLRTTDGGQSWTPPATPFLTDAGPSLYTGNCPNGMTDFQDLGGGKFAYAWYTTPCNSGNHAIVVRHYNGVDFATSYVATMGQQCSSFFHCGPQIEMTDRLNGVVYHGPGTTSAAVRSARYVVSNGVVASSTTLDDAYVPLPAAHSCSFILIRGSGGVVLSYAGSPAHVWALRPIGANIWEGEDTGAIWGAMDPAPKAGDNLVFTISESASQALILYRSCTGGETWTRTVLEAAGTFPSYPNTLNIGGSKFLTAFRYASTLGTIYSDDSTCTGAPSGGGGGSQQSATLSESPFFCSVIGNERFGYNYREDVIRYAGFNTRQIGTGLEFEGDADNYAYLAKVFTGTKVARVFFEIEADREGADSVFSVVFSTVNHGQWDEDPNEVIDQQHPLSTDAKGDGRTTGAFQWGLEVRFLEVGDRWNIQVFLHNGGLRTAIGQAYTGDNPNNKNGYSWTVDLRPETPSYALKRMDGSTISNGPLEKPLAGVASILVNQTIYAQWFEGYGADNLINANAFTALQDKSATSASTCIYGLDDATPVTAVGDQGASGPRTTPGGAPEALTPQAFVAPPSSPMSLPRQGVFLVGFTLAGAGLGWFLTGGRVEKKHGGLPDIIPGSPIITAGAAYAGMWLCVVIIAGSLWWIPILVTLAIVAALVFRGK